MVDVTFDVTLSEEAADGVAVAVLIDCRNKWLAELKVSAMRKDRGMPKPSLYDDVELSKQIAAVAVLLEWLATPAQLKELHILVAEQEVDTKGLTLTTTSSMFNYS